VDVAGNDPVDGPAVQHNGAMRSAKRPNTAVPSADVRQRIVALSIGVLAASAGGMVLAASEGTLAELPGLLLLVPGAIALRGNVFGAMGSRLGTAVHAGTFRLSARPDGVVGQNLVGAAALSVVMSAALGVMASGTAIVFGVAPTMTLADFVVVSTLGGLLASILVGVVTLALAAGSVRFGWDLDNVLAPLVSTLGDLATVPALVLAAGLAGHSGSTEVLGGGLGAMAVVVLVAAWRSPLVDARRIVRQSLPVLAAAGVLDLVAGVTIERRLASCFRPSWERRAPSGGSSRVASPPSSTWAWTTPPPCRHGPACARSGRWPSWPFPCSPAAPWSPSWPRWPRARPLPGSPTSWPWS